MKKLLLLLVAACFIFGANAQKSIKAVKMNQEKITLDSEYQGAVSPVARTVPTIPTNYSTDTKGGPAKIYVGEAHSQRSFRREECKVISYNKDLGLIGVAFILDEETYPDIAKSPGSVGIFYSADHGETWSGPVLLSDESANELRNYYLSGVIYNPEGNTVIEDAYGVCQSVAPDDPGGVGAWGDWNNQVFGSSTFGGANYFTEYFTNEEPDHSHDGYYSQFGLTQKEDFMKCFNIYCLGGWNAFTEQKLEDIHGTFNGTGFDWDIEHSVVDVPLDIGTDGYVMSTTNFTFSDAAAGMVWSDDGMIGYGWISGAIDPVEYIETGYQPILFRTIDGGDSWDYIELDFQTTEFQDFFDNDGDWLILPGLDDQSNYGDVFIPNVRSTEGAVDANGNLQLFVNMTSHYYDIFNHWERYANIGSRFAFAGCIIKLTIGEELIDYMLVDTLMSTPAISGVTNDSLYCGGDGWLHRMQITKDERSEEFFLTWTDTKESKPKRSDPNYMPDIKGWSYNITNSVHTDARWFTDGHTLPFEHYWFVHAAEYAYYNYDDETFTIPMLSGVGLDDFYGNTTSSEDACNVDYITGITFPAIVPLPPIGVDELSELSNFSVSQNLPNPATGITTIDISSETVAPVTVEILNLTGQIVHTIDAGIVNGNISINIDVSNLEAGVYIYTVTISGERVSKRMIVR